MRKYFKHTHAVVLLLATVFILSSSVPVSANIYMYRDEEGVLHFSNTPTTSKYRLYMKKEKTYVPSRRSTNKYDHIIKEASEKHRVSFSLIKAIIKAESDFNPQAVSRKGARGLMQIMPQNFKALNINNPFDPRENIMGGSRYFSELYDRFNGKLSLALAAYNAGPKAVDRYKKIPPYRETRKYIKKVMKYYRDFQKG